MRWLLRSGVSLLGLSLVSAAAAAVAAAPVDPNGSSTAVDAATKPAPNASAADGQAEIIVTGSRLKRALADTIEPTQIINAEQIESRGFTNVGEALAELPSIAPGINGAGSAQSGFGPGQTFVDFFGLGTQRTLTLVNGRRYVSSNTASIFGPTNAGSQVDLNTIPVGLVERIDVVAVGGAPIYGADAIAGTVNIILKHDYNGIEFEAQDGISDAGDARNYRLRALAGLNFAGGRGNVTISGEYNKSGGLIETDRRVTAEQRFFTAPAPGASTFSQVLILNRTIPSLSEQGIPFVQDFFALSPSQVQSVNGGVQPTVTNSAGQAVRFDSQGNLIPIDFGQATGNLINFSGGNGYSLAPVSNLQTPTERYLGNILASYQLTDHLRFFFEGAYSHVRGVNLVAQPAYNTALFGAAGSASGNFIVNTDNPFLKPEVRSAILNSIASAAANPDSGVSPDQSVFYLGRANTDLQNGSAVGKQEVYRFVAGFDGDFTIGDRNFTYEVVGNYGRSVSDASSPNLITQNLNNAIDAVAGPNGTIICRPGYTNANTASLSATCAPINLFGQGNVSQAALDYVTAIARSRSVNDQLVFTASATGEIFKLPGGSVGLVAGFEHREENARFDPGQFFFGDPQPDGTRNSFGASAPIDPISGGFKTNEGFGELRVPLVGPDMGWRFLDSFELKAAARYVSSNQAGGDFTWTGGGRLTPVPGLSFVGNFTRSIRAPAITEAFNPTSPTFVLANDPCDSRYINVGPDPARRAANCAAAGITQPFASNIVDFTSMGSVSGNPNLKNEIANSWTVGVQLRPHFVPRLAINVDWVNIDLKSAIVQLGAQDILQACYDGTSFPNAFCGQFDRDANHQVTFVRTGYLNAASLQFRGLQAAISYRIPTPFIAESGSVTLTGNYQYIDRLQQTVGTGDVNVMAGSVGNSRHKAVANVNYNSDVFNFNLEAQYFGRAAFDANETAGTRDIQGVGAVVFLNSSVAFNVAKRMTFRLTVNNLLNQSPPYPAPGGGGTVTYFSGILGRYYKASVTAHF